MARPITERIVSFGIDYGTSSSKIVVRDHAAPGGERAYLLERNGSFRYPSTVGIMDSAVIFGHTASDAQTVGTNIKWLESVKMRVAAEVTGDYDRYYHPPLVELPAQLSARNLAIASLWWLLSEADRATRQMVGTQIRPRMTVGIPMSFFDHSELRNTFVEIARCAWWLYRTGPLLADKVAISHIANSIEYAGNAVARLQRGEDRQWVRSEAEAAMHWPFHSPSVSDGTYGKVDIGAGTTNASLFRIRAEFSGGLWVKHSIAFYGAHSAPVGMDALDTALAAALGLNDPLQLRGQEPSRLTDELEAQPLVARTFNDIELSARQPWRQLQPTAGARFVGLAHPEWYDTKIFVIGGGSLVPSLSERVAIYPFDTSRSLKVILPESPPDLWRVNGQGIGIAALPFVMVAYGLSQFGAEIPVTLPSQAGPLPPMRYHQFKDSEDM